MAYVPKSRRIKRKRLSAQDEAKIKQLFKELHEVTEKQDRINLTIREILFEGDENCSLDPRWIPIHIMDAANGVILEISRHEGGLGNEEYVREKVDKQDSLLFQLKWSK